MQMNLFQESTEKKMAEMQKAVQTLETDCEELKNMAAMTMNEATTLEAENTRLEAEVKNLETEISGLKAMLRSKSVTPTSSICPNTSARRMSFSRRTPDVSSQGLFVKRLAGMDGFTTPSNSSSKASKIFSNLSFITSNIPKWF